MRFINYFLSVIFVAMLIFAFAIGGDMKNFLDDSSESFKAYIEGVKYSVSSDEGDDLRGAVNFFFDDSIDIDGDIKIFKSLNSFDDAYRNGSGVTFVNGSELPNGEYYFVAEVKTNVGGKYIVPIQLEIVDGQDVNRSLRLEDSLKFSELRYITIKDFPTIGYYIVGSKFSVEGMVATLTYDKMSIDITPLEFQTYGIKTLLKDSKGTYTPIDIGQTITENEISKSLYISNRELTVDVFVEDLKISQDIAHYGDYGAFFTKETSNDSLITNEAKSTFNYFWNTANTDLSSNGYGLVPSFTTNSFVGTTATTESLGYALISTIIGMENGWIDKYTAYERVAGTLATIENLDKYFGLFYSEVDLKTGEPCGEKKISLTDSAQLLTCVLITGSYFGGDLEEKTKDIYDGAMWKYFYSSEEGKYFYDEYNTKNGYYKMIKKYEGQLLVYILSEASSDGSLGYNAFYTMERHKGKFGKYDEFIHTWDGSLSGHLYAQAFINFDGLVDQKGVNWYKNSVIATYNSKEFSDSKANEYPSYKVGWGLSSSDMKKGYTVNHGSAPSGYTNNIHVYDGTVPVYSALSSINFYPEASVIALRNYSEIDYLQGTYGFYSAFDVKDSWTTGSYNAVEKGLTMTMFANYKKGMIWDLAMETPEIVLGLKKLGFQNYEYDAVTSATILTPIGEGHNNVTRQEADSTENLLDVSEETAEEVQ